MSRADRATASDRVTDRFDADDDAHKTGSYRNSPWWDPFEDSEGSGGGTSGGGGQLPGVRLTSYAMGKLVYLRDRGDSEIACFGISNAEDLLLIEDLVLIRQRATAVSVEFDDDAVADYFDRQADRGLHPQRFARVWVHTHPGASATPSITDERTFERVFGCADWSVMCILAANGNTFARMQFAAGPGGSVELPVRVDYSVPFAGSDQKTWSEEYDATVRIEPLGFGLSKNAANASRPTVTDDDVVVEIDGIPQWISLEDLTEAQFDRLTADEYDGVMLDE